MKKITSWLAAGVKKNLLIENHWRQASDTGTGGTWDILLSYLISMWDNGII